MPFDKKKIDDLTPEAKAKLDEALKAVDLQISEIAETHTRAETESAERVKAEAKLKEVEANWNTAYEEYGNVVNDLEATTKEKQEAEKKMHAAELKRAEAEKKLAESLNNKPAIDTSKFVTTEYLEEQRRKDAKGQAAYFGDTLDAVAEIERITKTRVSPKTLIQEASAAGKLPLEYAEEKYQLSAKRAESLKAERDKELADATRKGREDAISEMANPATRTLEDSRDPFYVPKEGKAAMPWDEGIHDPLEMKLKASSAEEFDAAFTGMVGIKKPD